MTILFIFILFCLIIVLPFEGMWGGGTPSANVSGTAFDYQGEIDCSGNPNYPAGVRGDVWIASVAGKIGGALGVDVEVGDTVFCKNDNAGGDQATVGTNWNAIQTNIDQATETVKGTVELATQAETRAGADDLRIVTPLKLRNLYNLMKDADALDVADDEEIVAPTGISGWGFVTAGDAEEYGQFIFKADGTVTLLQSSANVVNIDIDNKLCIYDAGSGIAIKNRLGATKKIRYEIKYSS